MKSHQLTKTKLPQLYRALDAEFWRVARHEEIQMDELVAEIASIAGVTTRQVYNWRTGRWSLPIELIPVICQRFHSRTLLEVLSQACSAVAVEVPQTFDLARIVSATVRADLRCYEGFLDAFESDGIQPSELAALRESAERVIHNAYQLVEIAAADCERRKLLKKEQPTHYSGTRQHHER
jgi:hypothetical protein